MSIYISNGNKKIKCNIFDLPSVKTCRSCLSCHKYCYAQKAERLYPAVLPCRNRNFEASKRNSFVFEVVNLLSKKKNNIVRIHSSGDFYSIDYIKKWYDIMKSLPDFRFYAYTKRDDLFSKQLLKNKPSNFTLIYSVDGIQDKAVQNIPNGYDKIAIVTDKKTNCKAQIDTKVKCGVDCFNCIDKKKNNIIIFRKH